jgi:hypothetical protein
VTSEAAIDESDRFATPTKELAAKQKAAIHQAISNNPNSAANLLKPHTASAAAPASAAAAVPPNTKSPAPATKK